MKTQNYKITDCKRLTLSCYAEVYLHQSSENKVTVECEEDNVIEVTDDQGHLKITSPPHVINSGLNGISIVNGVVVNGVVISGSDNVIDIDMSKKKDKKKKENGGNRFFGNIGQMIVGNVTNMETQIFNVNGNSVNINGNQIVGNSSNIQSGAFTRSSAIVHVYSPSFPSINISGAITLTFNDISQDILEMDSSGSCTLRLQAKQLTVLDLTVSGASKLLVIGNIESATVDCAGASDLSMTLLQARSTRIRCSGASSITLNGSTEILKAKISGASSLKGMSLTTETATLRASGCSSVTLRKPKHTLEKDTSGLSSIKLI